MTPPFYLIKNMIEHKIETLKAQIIIKKEDDLSLRKNVKYNRDDFINLNNSL